MKKRILFSLLMVLACWSPGVRAQGKGEKFVGVNLVALPYRVLELEGEYFLGKSIGVVLTGGYCFDRPAKTARHITENVLGGYGELGPRFYFFADEKWSSFIGVAYHFGRFRRRISIDVPAYYGAYQANDQEVQQRMGYSLHLGIQFRQGRWAIQPSFKFTVIGGRGAPYGQNYWVPGVGRVGVSRNALQSSRHAGFLPQVKLRFAL